MSKAVIFDMDGILIDSEPAWHAVETAVYGENGIHLTDEMMAETMGMRHDLVAAYWIRKYKRSDLSVEDIAGEVEKRMEEHVCNHVSFLPGARDVFQRVSVLGYKTAIASSSTDILINAVVERLGIQNVLDTTHSAEHEARGKPAPDVYLSAAKKLGIDPESCIAVEDSHNGVQSAKSAGMKVITIPDERYTLKASMEGTADLVLDSLEDITEEILRTLLL